MTSIEQWPLVVAMLVFALSAAAVWVAGTRLALYADAIAHITGAGTALLGVLMLGGVTSLPEIAVSVSASISGNAALAVNNLLGGLALQVVILALGDFALGGRALSFVVGSPRVLLQGVFCALLLAMVIAAIGVGERAFLGVGLWSTAILLGSIVLLWFITLEEKRDRLGWKAEDMPDLGEALESEGRPGTLGRAIALTAVVAVVILVAGYLLARTGEAIATMSGLGSSFVGATLVGFATSLPEISTVLAAIRLRRYIMAFGDIFGTNILDVAFIFLVDLAYRGPPVLGEVGAFSQVAAALGVLVTLLYVAGLIERRDDTLGRLGIDSWAVLASYGCGVALLYTLR